MKKRTIAIVAGGDSSEIVVSLRSAQGIYSFIDKERYNLYIVEMEGKRWEVVLPNGEKTPIDRNDFSFIENGKKKNFDFAYTVFCKVTSTSSAFRIQVAMYWYLPLLSTSSLATNI